LKIEIDGRPFGSWVSTCEASKGGAFVRTKFKPNRECDRQTFRAGEKVDVPDLGKMWYLWGDKDRVFMDTTSYEHSE
jgi:translation elongation factor P/translation initiation factor 5A